MRQLSLDKINKVKDKQGLNRFTFPKYVNGK